MDIVIRPLNSPADAAAFRALNEQWIVEHFSLEAEDHRQLQDPTAAFLAPGGEILLADLAGEVVGCVAVVPASGGAWELSKMAVVPQLRGHGIGRRLLSSAIEAARAAGAESVFLGSSTRLPAAVHLYESLGFQHVPAEKRHVPYVRADVYMELILDIPVVLGARAPS